MLRKYLVHFQIISQTNFFFLLVYLQNTLLISFILGGFVDAGWVGGLFCEMFW